MAEVASATFCLRCFSDEMELIALKAVDFSSILSSNSTGNKLNVIITHVIILVNNVSQVPIILDIIWCHTKSNPSINVHFTGLYCYEAT